MKNIINKIRPKIIDCTLRDGGYYNNWDFNIELIQKYINAVQRAGVDYIELGYRTQNKTGYFGPLAYTSEDFIEELNISKSIKLGVMINSSEFIQKQKSRRRFKILISSFRRKFKNFSCQDCL